MDSILVKYSISTITINVFLTKKMLITNFVNFCKEIQLNDVIIGLKYRNEFKEIIYKGNIKHTGIFQNQCTLKTNKINVKFFSNGNIHLTGCKKISDGMEYAILIYKHLKLNIDQNDINISISCINISCNINQKINQKVLYNQLINLNYNCIFKPEIYAGVKLIHKIDETHKITIVFFSSGMILGFGFKDISTIPSILNRFVCI